MDSMPKFSTREPEPIFSIKTMKACTGHSQSDFEYFKYFTAECDRRIRAGAQQLDMLADGAYEFNVNSDPIARAALGEVRRGLHALQSCLEWFKAKPDVARRFEEVLQSVADVSSAAETDFRQVMLYLGHP
jgi:hypothetical protein